MLTVKYIDRIVAIVTCCFVWQASAYINFVQKADDNSTNTIASDPTASGSNDSNRFTSTLMSLIGLNGTINNSRGPTHDTPPFPCRCREYSSIEWSIFHKLQWILDPNSDFSDFNFHEQNAKGCGEINYEPRIIGWVEDERAWTISFWFPFVPTHFVCFVHAAEERRR